MTEHSSLLAPDDEARSLQRGGTTGSRSGVAIYTALTHVLAFATFGLVVRLITKYYDFGSPADGSQAAVPSFEFGTFGTHPLLMVTAFGLLSPVATVAYKTYESLLGVSHTVVKLAHAFLQTAATIIGLVGVASMYKTHQGALHFQTAHSWLGVGAMALYAVQWVFGTLVYLNPWSPGWLRAKLMSTHIAIGTISIFLTLMSVFSGPIALVWKPEQAGGFVEKDVWQLANVAAITSALLLVAIFMTFWESSRIHLGKSQ
jgi:hypothetical protein